MEQPCERIPHVLTDVKAVSSRAMLDLIKQGVPVATLNAEARRIFELIDGKRRVSDIATLMSEEFNAPANVIRDDVRRIVTEFVELQLVTLVDE